MKKFTKYPITASSLVDEFMKYHEDEDNHYNNEYGFREMYDILSKYGTENEPVDQVFIRAPEDDQKRMIELIKPDEGESITISELSDKFYKLQIKDERGNTTTYEDGYLDGIYDCLDAFGLSL